MNKLTPELLIRYEYAEHEPSGTIQFDCLTCRRILDPNPRDFATHEEFQQWAPTVPVGEEWDYFIEMRPGNTTRKLIAWLIGHERDAAAAGWHRSLQDQEEAG